MDARVPLSRTILSFFFPAGLIVALSAVALRSDLAPLFPAMQGLSFALYVGAAVLAWRFHSTRMMFAALVLFAAEAGMRLSLADARAALDVAAILVPANLIALAFVRERGFLSSTTATIAGLLGGEFALAGVVCRPELEAGGILEAGLIPSSALRQVPVPQLALLIFAAGGLFFLARFVLLRTPVESGMFWTMVACLLAFATKSTPAWLTVAGAVLAMSVVENSYLMAFHDQLTGLPARRAFYRTASMLPDSYAIAIGDVDHFKKFNDTYGHETGDQVLRMVAARMARVTGGGKAFRWGGEEFVLVFPGKTAAEAVEHLELLRELVEASSFILRAGDRRKHSAEDRGKISRRAHEVWVTVSIGVADGGEDLRRAMDEADRALYAAKAGGRNRVEIAVPVGLKLQRFSARSAAPGS